MHCRKVALRDVGRVRDDGVERPREDFVQAAERIRLAERDPGAERAAVLGGDRQRRVRQVGRENLCPGQCERQARGDAAAAGAHVEQGPCPAFVVYHPGDQLLGFGAGDQHPFAYGEAVPVEFRVPHHVLHGTAGGELCGHRFEPIGRHRCAGVGQQGR